MVKSTTRQSLKLKICKAKVRYEGKKIQPCGTEYLGDTCPKKPNHLLKMKTGFCSNGWCEGTKATDWRGNPVPTCEFIYTCPCECHDMMGRMFEITESERIVVQSSAYQPPERTYWMPSDDPLPPSSRDNPTDAPVVVESPVPDRVPATIRHTYTPTPTGRAARGELELWVKEECDVWLVDEPGVPCTPAYLADQIGRSQGINPPSVGAIDAVFKRWEKLGFAVIDRKPTRFTRYTEDGVRLGLDQMKTQAKKRARLQLADDRRNLRR